MPTLAPKKSIVTRGADPAPPANPPEDLNFEKWWPRCYYCQKTTGKLGSALISFRPRRRVLTHRDCNLFHQFFAVANRIMGHSVPALFLTAFCAIYEPNAVILLLGGVMIINPVILLVTALYYWRYIPPEKLS